MQFNSLKLPRLVLRQHIPWHDSVAPSLQLLLSLRYPTFREMSSSVDLDVARRHVGTVVAFLGKTEARDKVARTIQYFAKFIAAGQPGALTDVEKQASQARKVGFEITIFPLYPLA